MAPTLAAVDLNLLVAFDALMAERNVTRAAQRVGIGQPAMSSALSRLRALFHDELFVRVPGRMEPTPKALQLATPIGDALQQIRRALDPGLPFDAASAQRIFRIGATDYTEFVLLPPLNAYLRQAAPGIDIRIVPTTTDRALELLDLHELDFAIGTFAALPKRLSSAPLFTERFVCVARRDHPDLGNAGLQLDSFLALPHLLRSLRGDADGTVDQALARRGLKRHVVMTVTNFLVVPFILERSDAIATLAERVARRLAGTASLAIHDPPLQLEPWTTSLVWGRAVAQDAGAAWLQSTIREVAREA